MALSKQTVDPRSLGKHLYVDAELWGRDWAKATHPDTWEHTYYLVRVQSVCKSSHQHGAGAYVQPPDGDQFHITAEQFHTYVEKHGFAGHHIMLLSLCVVRPVICCACTSSYSCLPNTPLFWCFFSLSWTDLVCACRSKRRSIYRQGSSQEGWGQKKKSTSERKTVNKHKNPRKLGIS